MSNIALNATNITGGNTEDVSNETQTEESTAVIFLEGGLVLLVNNMISSDFKLFQVCVIGVTCNFLSFLVMIRHRTFRNSFGYLTAYHALSNAAVLLIFILWAVPWTILPLPNQLQWMNLRVGQLSLFFVETAFHCCLFISFNRFVAITYPLQYRKMFTGRTTLSIIIFISLVSALYWSIYFKHGCDFFFDHQYRVWAFGLESCSVWLSFYIDMSYNVCLFLVVGFIDIVTLLQLRSLAKNMQSRRLNISSNQNKGMPRRQKKELVFFLQAFTNSCIYAFMLICFHLLSRVVTTNFELFLCTTFIWGFSHATGGVILVVFNPEIRRNLLALRNITNSLHDPATVTSVRPYPATVATRTKC
ncbi:hypothetical protein NECAME_04121 [Necator americanus]|uniref:G-protein coupled receptors family 1 profile domain-containing protein n=1 Tax=Necator americanus TaxID=51031 RepID=W2SZ83_NECAM|nr:hypothetical protein NECAME_04121 [Necator americanus]ETN74256.1 hypothetical protein NECAME_04121 [Necator americanus]